MHRSFREILNILDDKGSLVRIKKEVDPKYEMGAVMTVSYTHLTLPPTPYV